MQHKQNIVSQTMT